MFRKNDKDKVNNVFVPALHLPSQSQQQKY